MGIYINCDIYIKKNSDIFSVDDNPLLKSILNLTDDVASVISEEEEIKRLNDMKASLLDDMRKREGENDYSKCDKFYRLVTNGDEVVLMSLGNNFMDTIIRYSNFDDMLNDFESLNDYLYSSSFVGKHFKPWNPVATLLGIKCIALYKKEHSLIAMVYDDEGNARYTLFASDMILNDKLEYTDEVDYNYDEKDMVYKKIYKQFNEGYEKKLY